MKKLIIHVGPGKCGSTSIQNFFKSNQQVHSTQKLYFRQLNPKWINEASQSSNFLEQNAEIQKIKQLAKNENTLILSHEFLFQKPNAVAKICKIFGKCSRELLIIGYSRRQSEFIGSSFSQWIFRSKKRLIESNKYLEKWNINPSLFTNHERYMIASAITDFQSARQLSGDLILNWHERYKLLHKCTKEFRPLIQCGVLPTPRAIKTNALIKDFCLKTKIQDISGIDNEIAESDVANISFNGTLVEAISNAQLLREDTFIGPHEKNEELHTISQAITSTDALKTKFHTQLEAYIDSYFLSSNTELCKSYNLPLSYFKPAEILTKDKIRALIEAEHKNRFDNPERVINAYQRMNSELAQACVNLLNTSA